MSTTAQEPSRARLPSIVAVGVLFLVLGALDVYQGLAPIVASVRQSRLAGDDVLVLAIGIVAAVGGIHLIRGRRWARWLLVAWMVLHVAISVGKPSALGAHLAIFGAIAFVLFRSGAAPHFATRSAPTTHPQSRAGPP